MTKEKRATRTTEALKNYYRIIEGDIHRQIYATDIQNIWDLSLKDYPTGQAADAIGKALQAGYMLGYEQALRDCKNGRKRA